MTALAWKESVEYEESYLKTCWWLITLRGRDKLGEKRKYKCAVKTEILHHGSGKWICIAEYAHKKDNKKQNKVKKMIVMI
jgi:hypothetical protein